MTDSTAIATSPQQALMPGNLTRDQVDLIKRTICKDFSDDELMLFLHQAERMSLDPLSREIYGFKGKDKRISIVTGIDGLRSRADDTGNYMPGREPTFTEGKSGVLLSATAYVKRWDDHTDSWVEISATAWLVEQKRGSPIWGTAPHVMLAKCAEAFAFRRAFPRQLGGLYTSDEMPDREPAPPAPRMRETTAAVLTPNQMVWRVMSELGLSVEDVKVVLAAGRYPDDSSEWTTHDVEAICGTLRVRAKAGTFEQPVEEPPPGPRPGNHHGDAAHAEAMDLGASEEQWVTACEVALVGEVPGLAWNEGHTNLVIGELEKILGM